MHTANSVVQFFTTLETERIKAYKETTVDTVVFHIRTGRKSKEKYELRFPSSNTKQQFIDLFRVVRKIS